MLSRTPSRQSLGNPGHLELPACEGWPLVLGRASICSWCAMSPDKNHLVGQSISSFDKSEARCFKRNQRLSNNPTVNTTNFWRSAKLKSLQTFWEVAAEWLIVHYMYDWLYIICTIKFSRARTHTHVGVCVCITMKVMLNRIVELTNSNWTIQSSTYMWLNNAHNTVPNRHLWMGIDTFCEFVFCVVKIILPMAPSLD